MKRLYRNAAWTRHSGSNAWIADPAKVAALTDTSVDDYWDHPVELGVRAYQRLGLDGILDVNVPSERGGYTLVTKHDMEERAEYTPERVAELADALPEPDEVIATFDEQAAYDSLCNDMARMQALCGDALYWCPARWEVIPNFEWYREYGYETYLLAICMYPDQVRRLYVHSAVQALCKARVIARMVAEGIHPQAMLCGMDICGQNGPLVAPEFLREQYFPLVRTAIQPLRDAGAKLVWHCDGDVRPILDDILALGVGGLQGFQDECGVHLEDIVERRTSDGDPLIVFGPIGVTTTLVNESPAGVRKAVHDAIRRCDGKASLVLFTSNEILPDVPLENMRAMYQALDEYE